MLSASSHHRRLLILLVIVLSSLLSSSSANDIPQQSSAAGAATPLSSSSRSASSNNKTGNFTSNSFPVYSSGQWSVWWTGTSSTTIGPGGWVTLTFDRNSGNLVDGYTETGTNLMDWDNSRITIPSLVTLDPLYIDSRWFWIELQVRLPDTPRSSADGTGCKILAKRAGGSTTDEGESWSWPDDRGRRVCTSQALVYWIPQGTENDWFQIQVYQASGVTISGSTQIRLAAIWLRTPETGFTGYHSYAGNLDAQTSSYWWKGTSSMMVPSGQWTTLTSLTKQLSTWESPSKPIFGNDSFKIDSAVPAPWWVTAQVRLSDQARASTGDTCGIRIIPAGSDLVVEGFAAVDGSGRRVCYVQTIIKYLSSSDAPIQIQVYQQSGVSIGVQTISLQIHHPPVYPVLSFKGELGNNGGVIRQNVNGWNDYKGSLDGPYTDVSDLKNWVDNPYNVLQSNPNSVPASYLAGFRAPTSGYYWINSQIRLADYPSGTGQDSIGLTFWDQWQQAYCSPDGSGRRVCHLRTLAYHNEGDVFTLRLWEWAGSSLPIISFTIQINHPFY